ncbi:hypothetical protein KO507_14890 [Gilvimarinus agarilyticus]|uniref:hypothetical protein n=1 Tax=Gilvimarinus sp. 2_MG-2023 TaxID=3062666 RepID=UPI001C089394|nr:hypothetical protein [Gilvimarinus sp. 2_MG-2023]MBU2887054.1 hypothetical protein [Gilvimarinus agarilyticus]MDO6571714.1 hypothetical protein [Gilvimarinus sp. 2_MG-2023]
MIRNLGRYRRLAATCFLASACFVALAIYGWGLSWQEAGSYLLITVVLLAVLLLLAAVMGWVIHKLRR